MTTEFSSQYEPKNVEDKWIDLWINRNIFTPLSDQSIEGKENFAIVIPPPNVTGSLHVGHALNTTLQDILVRYQRMKGNNVLWVVGTDHAGIATQNVVERQLAQQKISRHDLGREKFIEKVWEWKNQSGGTIISQQKRLGASCDYQNERFTMDEGLCQAVKKVFVDLYHQDLIYRGKRLINWCPRCHTALSDLEVEHKNQKGHLWHIRYQLENQQTSLVVATTRPETLFGDVAVAVNPADERYQNYIGQNVILPFLNKKIPVIADDSIDMAFGTGVVKITPAHDFNDFEMGKRHQLTPINIFTESAYLNENAGAFSDQDRYKARQNILHQLEEEQKLDKIEDHQLSVGQCYRCSTVVEPYLSDQWFVKTQPLAEKAIHAVQSGQTRFIPKHWEKTYFQWMENIQDWCISRQIWWGHQIPAWYLVDEKTKDTYEKTGTLPKENLPKPVVQIEQPLSDDPHKFYVQDSDVLDTWFSSALWPFSTMGWPENTQRLKTFYPTAVLSTAFDIIFFWVARMMMMGVHFMQEVPFKDVYIHALIRDPLGQKMSKSKGNVVDPLEMMYKYGTDAFRFTLAAFAAQGRDIKLDEARIESYRHFCNKIWNATRFSLMMAQEFRSTEPLQPQTVTLAVNKWILAKISALSKELPKKIENYEFNTAALALYKFFWNQLCDWYIELIKPIFKDAPEQHKTETAHTLFYVLDLSLKMLHPFMPFLTEEIWQLIRVDAKDPAELKEKSDFLTYQDYPQDLDFKDFDSHENDIDTLILVISAIRSIRQDTGLKSNVALKVLFKANQNSATSLQNNQDALFKLAKIEQFDFTTAAPQEACALGLANDIQVYVPLAGLIDISAEKQRLQKKKEKTLKNIELIEQKFANAEFINNAPDDLIQEQKDLLLKLKEDEQTINEAVALLKTDVE